MDFVNRENKRLEDELESKNKELAEVDQFMKDRKNMSANLIKMKQEKEMMAADLKQLEVVVREMKSKDENSDPNEMFRHVPRDTFEAEVKKCSDLESTIEDLKSQVRVLKTKETDLAHVRMAHTSDKEAFHESLKQMKDTNNTLRDEHEKSIVRIRMLEKERDQLQSDVDFYKERVQNLERNYESNKAVMQRLNDEKGDRESGENHLRERIKGLEDELATTIK